MEWELPITYDGKPYKLKAVKEYESAQIMRIRVHGKISTILLETNFPMAALSKGKAITWKIREGKFLSNGKQEAQLLTRILELLEYFLKNKDVEETKQAYLGRTKH